MKQYKVYRHPDGRIEAVKDGWSWPGFFFGIFWLAYKQLWVPATITFFITVVLAGVYDILVTLFGMLAGLLFGAVGNEWVAKNLEKRGFELVGTYKAYSPDHAKALYTEEQTKVKAEA